MAVRLFVIFLLAAVLCTVREAGGRADDAPVPLAVIDVEPPVIDAEAAVPLRHAVCSDPVPDVTHAQPRADRAPSSPDAGRVFRPPRPALG